MTLGRLLKYSKHFKSLPCNCSKTFGFLRNCDIKDMSKNAPSHFSTSN